MVFIVDL